MATINSNFLKLKAGYLFPEIARRVKAYTEANPDKADRVIRCGIGDVTEPLPPSVVKAMHEAVDEMASRDTFKGYGPEQGYAFLREAIVENQYADLGISADEIFISDGSKCDTGNILDIFGKGNTIAITDPVYPVYVDTNVMAGNTGDAGRIRRLRRHRLPPLQRRKQLLPRHPEGKSRPHLPLLPEQPHRHHRHPRTTRRLGEIRQGTPLDHPL